MPDPSAAEMIGRYRLTPLPDEGGWFRRTHLDDFSSAILFLLTTQDVGGVAGTISRRSALHLLPSCEVWHFHAGAPVEMLLLDERSGVATRPVLGSGADRREPQVVVAPMVWQGATTRGPWSLLGTTMAPAYDDDGFRLADRETAAALGRRWPDQRSRILELTEVLPSSGGGS